MKKSGQSGAHIHTLKLKHFVRVGLNEFRRHDLSIWQVALCLAVRISGVVLSEWKKDQIKTTDD